MLLGPVNTGITVGIVLLSCTGGETLFPAYYRLMATILDSQLTQASENSLCVLRGLENMGIAVEISLPSRTQASKCYTCTTSLCLPFYLALIFCQLLKQRQTMLS